MMTSDITTSISTRVNTPVGPNTSSGSSSVAETGKRQVIAEQSGQVVPSVSQSEENGETRTESTEFDVKEAVSNLSDYVQNLERSLSFTVDDVSGKTVITVSDPENDEVIRQIPSEELLQVARHYAELEASEGKGVLIEEQV